MARQLARGMGSFFKDCDCTKPTRCSHLYSIRFRDALGRQHVDSSINVHIVPRVKHRKVGEFREVPLPRSVPEAIERHEAERGTATKDGYLLRGPSGCYTEPLERRQVKKLFEDLPPEESVGVYGFRH
ncbi:hypothetical protein [Streptomyces sp. C10-9-1]|uniref:hypothetical protein n=1 Tax=Streptomyces sp. C10-9-1 TaxID=1859285 RepID=UPI003F49E6A3